MRIAGHQFWWYGGTIQKKGGIHIDNPVIEYITSMLRRMRPETVRAVYMVVQELDRASALTDRVP